MNLAGVILAGGKSTRMGRDKSKLTINNKTLLQQTQYILSSAGIKDVYISGAQGIIDTYDNKGPLAGISSCLQRLNKYDYIFFTPVDMPLINKYVVLKLISEKNLNATYFKNHFLPLIIKNNLINRKIITQQLDNNKLSIRNMLERLDATSLKSHFPESVFLNANTKKDWQEIKEILENNTTL